MMDNPQKLGGFVTTRNGNTMSQAKLCAFAKEMTEA